MTLSNITGFLTHCFKSLSEDAKELAVQSPAVAITLVIVLLGTFQLSSQRSSNTSLSIEKLEYNKNDSSSFDVGLSSK